ncbi:YggT family protein [Nakamurella lactea]|uniref:YggT family protein n=1 Tax=Nakamurella lactea TaxID=459515 RepID=UPI00042A76AB|nr:YggT family protein [Nakamurella lactea]
MNILWQTLFLLLWTFRWLLLGRLVFDFVRIFARNWRPVGGGAVALEVLYATTDPPIRVLRKIIPPVRLGGVGFDLSVMVLLVVVVILMALVGNAAWATL